MKMKKTAYSDKSMLVNCVLMLFFFSVFSSLSLSLAHVVHAGRLWVTVVLGGSEAVKVSPVYFLFYFFFPTFFFFSPNFVCLFVCFGISLFFVESGIRVRGGWRSTWRRHPSLCAMASGVCRRTE